jgi:ubiquinone/menaquinone biosynthesis C-methylase UbiE
MSEAHIHSNSEPSGASADAHVHNHAHVHSHDFVKENQKHFDATAEQYDARPDVQELARRVRQAILTIHPSLFDEDKTTLLDYACGTGQSRSMYIILIL